MRKIFLITLLPAICMAQKNYPALLDEYVQAHSAIKGFSGTVLVMQHNKPLLKKAYGLADREWSVPNTIDTKYRIGSITKQFTAASILQLIEQGKLTLTDKLSRFLPDFPKGDSVTIQMLLTHTSGIASYTDQKEFMDVATQSWSKDSIISYIKSKPYNFSPGAKFLYNNSGFFLLGYIIEKTSAQTYGDYLRSHIFNKLGMNNTGVDNLDTILSKRARGYSKYDRQYVNADFISLEWPFSAGALYSTVEDMYKWDRALYGTSILTETSKHKMFLPGKGKYGYGLFIDSFDNHLRIWHRGSISGFLGSISRYINDDLCIIVLSNDEYDAEKLSNGLADILFDEPYEVPYTHKNITLDPSLLDRYVGKYKAFLTVEVIKKNGKLYRHRDGTPDIELKADSETILYYDDDSDRRLEFELDGAGKVTKIWFVNNGQRGEMQRVQ